MIEWEVVASRSSGISARCEYCGEYVARSQPRKKVWNSAMASRGGTNGPGIWVHTYCAEELLGLVTLIREDGSSIEDL
jgi:hypothetical protein